MLISQLEWIHVSELELVSTLARRYLHYPQWPDFSLVKSPKKEDRITAKLYRAAHPDTDPNIPDKEIKLRYIDHRPNPSLIQTQESLYWIPELEEIYERDNQLGLLDRIWHDLQTHIVDDTSFGDEGLFCEFAYWVDFETRIVEIEGVTRGTAEIPFADLEVGLFQRMNEEYWNKIEEMEDMEVARRIARAKAKKALAHPQPAVGTPEQARGADQHGKVQPAFVLWSPLEIDVNVLPYSPEDGSHDQSEQPNHIVKVHSRMDNDLQSSEHAGLVYEKGIEEPDDPTDGPEQTPDAGDKSTEESPDSAEPDGMKSPASLMSPTLDIAEDRSLKRDTASLYFSPAHKRPEEYPLPASDDESSSSNITDFPVVQEAPISDWTFIHAAPDEIPLPASDTGSATYTDYDDTRFNGTTSDKEPHNIPLPDSEDESSTPVKHKAMMPYHLRIGKAPEEIPLPDSDDESPTNATSGRGDDTPKSSEWEWGYWSDSSSEASDPELTRPTGTLEERMSRGNGKFRRGDIPYHGPVKSSPKPAVIDTIIEQEDEEPRYDNDVWVEDEEREYMYDNSAWRTSDAPEDIPLPMSSPESKSDGSWNRDTAEEERMAVSALRRLVFGLGLPTSPARGQTLAEMIPIDGGPTAKEIVGYDQEMARARAEALRAELDAEEENEGESEDNNSNWGEFINDDVGEYVDVEWFQEWVTEVTWDDEEDPEDCEGPDQDDASDHGVRKPYPPLDLPPNWLEIAAVVFETAGHRVPVPPVLLEQTPEEMEEEDRVERWRRRADIQWRMGRGYYSE
jgi:hypothetical protein